MTFYDAMMKGIRLGVKHVRFTWYSSRSKVSCALGTADVGFMGYLPSECWANDGDRISELTKQFPILDTRASACPEPMCKTNELWAMGKASLWSMVMHLNDQHGWSREAIANWVDPHPELHERMPAEAVKPSEVACYA